MNSKKDTCSKIIIPAQTGPICWFMSTFVAMFYSQRSRKILIEASKYWNKQIKLFSIFNDILKDKKYDYSQLKYEIFEPMLIYLNNSISAKSFPYNPRFNNGFIAEIYIGRLYKLLNIDSIIFEYNPNAKEDWLAYSIFNEEFDNIISWNFNKNNVYEIIDKYYDQSDRNKIKIIINNYRKKILPPVLIVIVRDVEVDSKYTKLYHEKFPEILLNSANIDRNDEKNIKSMKKNITYMGVKYTLDSVILSNWNRFYLKMGHAIAGITCKNKRYIYNSWARETNDYLNIPYACKLMKHDWMENQHFCLNIKDCIPIHFKNEKHIMREFENKDYCFNFMNGSRLLIYIRDDITSDNSSSSSSPSSGLSSSIRMSSSSRLSSSSRSSSSLPESEKSEIFELILMTMRTIINIITPFLTRNNKKLLNVIDIKDLKDSDNLFLSLIKMIILLFQKLVNEKISELEFKNERANLINDIISKSNNKLSLRSTTISELKITEAKYIVSTEINAKYTDDYTNRLKDYIIKNIKPDNILYTKFNSLKFRSLFHKFCLSIYLIILYAQVVGINDEEIFLMNNNNLIPSSRIIQLSKGGKQVKKPKKISKKKV